MNRYRDTQSTLSTSDSYWRKQNMSDRILIQCPEFSAKFAISYSAKRSASSSSVT